MQPQQTIHLPPTVVILEPEILLLNFLNEQTRSPQSKLQYSN